MNRILKIGEYAQHKTPHLIFTDINVPKKSGLEILKELKKDEILKPIPIVILTSSEYPEDIMLCYTLQANAVVYKEADLNSLVNTMRCVLNFFVFSPFSFYNSVNT